MSIIKTNFPPLFCQNEDGSIQEWNIWVERDTTHPANAADIKTRYGRVGGAMQCTTDTVSQGKNAGKKNATTPVEQATKEAQSKWEKKKKSGYVEHIGAAEAGQIDTNFIAGGIDPMLAHKWRDHSQKMFFPALAQPKFDGTRCIAILKNGKCTLWSRTRKQITGVPHVAIHLERLFPRLNIVLDGELYNHDFKNDFEKLLSFIRQQTAKPGHEVVQYHVYDVVQVGRDNTQRDEWLTANIPADHNTIKRVETVKVADSDELMEYFAKCREAGYEGCMVRNPKGTYQNKRSYNLLKVKEMDDDEFEIVGTEEGRGKMAGKAIFVCKTKKGATFNVKKEGSIEDLAKYLNNRKVIGKKLTVRFQGYTADGIPRFPVGVAVRDYE